MIVVDDVKKFHGSSTPRYKLCLRVWWRHLFKIVTYFLLLKECLLAAESALVLGTIPKHLAEKI